MKCPKCKTINDDEYIFCVNCGSSIAVNPGIDAVPVTHKFTTPGGQGGDLPSVQTRYVPHPSVEMEIEKKPKRTWIYVTLGVLAVLILGGIAAVFLIKPNNKMPFHESKILNYLVFY